MSNEKTNPYLKRIATRLRGTTLKHFLADCQDREEKESVILREIVSKHYADKNKR